MSGVGASALRAGQLSDLREALKSPPYTGGLLETISNVCGR